MYLCRKVYAARPQDDMSNMGNLLINLPNSAMTRRYSKINHRGKCLRNCHPSYVNESREITAELPILLFGLVALALGFELGL